MEVGALVWALTEDAFFGAWPATVAKSRTDLVLKLVNSDKTFFLSSTQAKPFIEVGVYMVRRLLALCGLRC